MFNTVYLIFYRLKHIIFIFIFLILFVNVSNGFYQYNIEQITNDSYLNTYPKISNNGHMVWVSDAITMGLGDIYLYNGVSGNKISIDGYRNSNPKINNIGQVVWSGTNGIDTEIFYYDGSVTINLSNRSELDDYEPDLNDNGFVVWRGLNENNRYDIMLYNGSTIEKITNNDSVSDYKPKINNGNQITWVQGGHKIAFFDGIKTSIISIGETGNTGPQINDSGSVVWWGPAGNSGYHDIFYYDGNETVNISNSDLLSETEPKINNSDYIVFTGQSSYGSNDDIFLFNGITIEKLSDNERQDTNPVIGDDGLVAWHGADATGDWDIYLSDGEKTINLSNNTLNDTDPDINANNKVIWSGWDGSDREIFVASPFLVADFGLDGDVDGSDLNMFRTGYSANDAVADINGDGLIGLSDVERFAQEFGNIYGDVN